MYIAYSQEEHEGETVFRPIIQRNNNLDRIRATGHEIEEDAKFSLRHGRKRRCARHLTTTDIRWLMCYIGEDGVKNQVHIKRYAWGQCAASTPRDTSSSAGQETFSTTEIQVTEWTKRNGDTGERVTECEAHRVHQRGVRKNVTENPLTKSINPLRGWPATHNRPG